jgi:hypothetical protein
MNRVRLAAAAGVLAALVSLPAGAQAPRSAPGEGPLTHVPRATSSDITAQDLRTRLYLVADDSMMGREAGTRGNVMVTDYIAAELARLGLQPAGENGTFFQTVPLVEKGVESSMTLSVNGEVVPASDFAPVPIYGNVIVFRPTFRAQDAPVVYGGRVGEPASMLPPEQAAGKVVVFAAPLAPNGQPAAQFWARGTFERYADAAAVVFATLDLSPPGLLGFFRSTQVELAKPAAVAAPVAPPGLIVTRAVAERMVGAPLAEAALGAAGGHVSGAFEFFERPTAYPARNVVAVFPGSDPALRHEYVALGAHSDHEGVSSRAVDHDSLRVFNRMLRPEGADQTAPTPTPEQAALLRAGIDSLRALRPARSDSIYNGADDDGSGVVALLEVAEALAGGQAAPRRSILFVWHTAEEKGLLGAQHFGENATVARENIVAHFNMDMVGRGAEGDVAGGGASYLQLVGSRRLSTELGDLVEEVNARGGHGFTFDYTYDADGHPQNIYCRSDHYHYARWGIPSTFFTTGGHSEYHMVTDEPQYIDYDKLTAVSRLVMDVAVAVADRDARPAVDRPVPDPDAPCRQ